MFKIAWSPIYEHPLPEGHRFPMEKYPLLREQLLYEGTVYDENFFEPRLSKDQDILPVHDKEYLFKLKHQTLDKKEERRTGFPQSALLTQRELTITQGSIDGALFALQFGAAANIAGGTHHAYKDRGEGFCLINDIAVAAHHLLTYTPVSRIAVVDLDVHQGNGTAKIFENEPSVFTFSMHGKNNYPMQKERSDWDVPLENQTSDDEYLSLLKNALPTIIDKAKPDFVFFQSGVDILETDKLGKLSVSQNGCQERDVLVFEWCKQYGLPVFINMGGGYSPKVSDVVNAHANTYRSAVRILF